MDAPVSGGTPAAEQAKLSGEKEVPGIGPQVLVDLLPFTRASHFGVTLFFAHSQMSNAKCPLPNGVVSRFGDPGSALVCRFGQWENGLRTLGREA